MGRRREQTLSEAHRVGQLARVTCHFCHVTRHFEPADLERLLGDVPFHALLDRMRCEKCRRRDYLVAVLTIPTAEERLNTGVRRLVDVRYMRRVTWRDE